MRVLLAVRFALACLAAFVLVGCGHYAVFDHFSRQPDYSLPKKVPLVVSRSMLVRTHDDGGYADTLALVVQEELREHGIEAEIIEGREHGGDPAPRVELRFIDFTAGNQAERYFTMGVVGQAELRVDCRVINKEGREVMAGQITGRQTDTSAAVRDAAYSAGRSIARALTDPKWAPDPKPSIKR